MSKLNLEFGYKRGLPETATAAWGARAILYKDGGLDLVVDRKSVAGDKEKADWICRVLDKVISRVRENVKRLVDMGDLDAKRDQEAVLYEDAEIKVVGNTNASYGYLYLVAFLQDDVASRVAP